MRTNTALALLALAVIMLVGCKQPIGMPGGSVHAASSIAFTCTVDSNQTMSGSDVWYHPSPYGPPGDTYFRENPYITWLLHKDRWGRPQPHTNGFCIFHVPHMNYFPAQSCCSLYYYQKEHSVTGFARLVVTVTPNSTNLRDSVNWWNEWNGDSIGTDQATYDEGWHAIPLTDEAKYDIFYIAYQPAGGYFSTGWITRDTAQYIFATAYGATSATPPYIRVFSLP